MRPDTLRKVLVDRGSMCLEYPPHSEAVFRIVLDLVRIRQVCIIDIFLLRTAVAILARLRSIGIEGAPFVRGSVPEGTDMATLSGLHDCAVSDIVIHEI
jgi:hypothetical protein